MFLVSEVINDQRTVKTQLMNDFTGAGDTGYIFVYATMTDGSYIDITNLDIYDISVTFVCIFLIFHLGIFPTKSSIKGTRTQANILRSLKQSAEAFGCILSVFL